MSLLTALMALVVGLPAQVDLPLTPASQIVPVGGVGDVELHAVTAAPEDVVSIEVILSWDPAQLLFLGATPEDFPEHVSGFLPDPDGVNLDLTDGDALYTVLAPLGAPVTVDPDVHVATFHFEVLATGGPLGGEVSMLPALGSVVETRVLSPTPGLEITGTLSDPVEIVVPGFGPPDVYPVGDGPCDVIAKDLDGDGSNDLATADSGSDTVTVLLNDGAGLFPASITIPLDPGDLPAALAAGELVAGGGCDLAVAATGSDRVLVVDNAPPGTFTVAAALPTAPFTEPVGIDVGDLDGSALDDLVVAMQGDLLPAGTGGVAVSLDGAPLVALPAPSGGFLRPQNVLLADLDGDGDLDAVVTMMGTAGTPTVTDNVLLYENDGLGAFAPPVTLGVPQNPRGLCAGDLDGDGDTDLAVTAESFPSVLPGTIEVLLNDGLVAGSWSAGDFSGGGSFTGGVAPRDLACADLEDDSIPGFCPREDLVAVNFGSEDVTWFVAYDATGPSIEGTVTTDARLAPFALVVADLDGDKTPDTAVANKGSGSMSVMLDAAEAQAKTFGAGCPGTNGVPQIAAVGSPNYGNPAFGVALSSAREFAPTLLGLSLGQATTTLGPGCDLYLSAPLVLVSVVTDGAGEVTVTTPIPGAASAFAGCEAFFQYFVFDPLGALGGEIAMSDALRIKVGL